MTKLVTMSYFPGGIGRAVRRVARRAAVSDDEGGWWLGPIAAPPQIIVVQHWGEELKRLVPTK